MRMNYELMPTDYINELKRAGKRKKAMAFMDYFDDVENGAINSYGFYANAWSVSKRTAWNWIKEFKYEIDLFINHWKIKNNYHLNEIEKLEKSKQDRSAKFSGKRLVNDEANDSNRFEVPKNRGFEESRETTGKREVNEVFNIKEEGGGELSRQVQREVQELIEVWMFNGGNWGVKRDELIREWSRLRGKIPLKRMKEAIVAYVHDGEIKNRYGLVKFLELGVYALYMRVRIRVLNKESMSWLVGEYSKKEETLYTSNENYKLSYEVIVDKYRKGELEFEFEEVA